LINKNTQSVEEDLIKARK